MARNSAIPPVQVIATCAFGGSLAGRSYVIAALDMDSGLAIVNELTTRFGFYEASLLDTANPENTRHLVAVYDREGEEVF